MHTYDHNQCYYGVVGEEKAEEPQEHIGGG